MTSKSLWNTYRNFCYEIALFSRVDDGQRSTNQVGEEKELWKEADQK